MKQVYLSNTLDLMTANKQEELVEKIVSNSDIKKYNNIVYIIEKDIKHEEININTNKFCNTCVL